MNHPVAAKQQLKDAFELFNQVSEQLTGSYAVLQRQVVSLEQKLTASVAERSRLLDEMRTLHQEIGRTQRLSSMGEMTARLAHQIRTPLATALLYASQLKQPNLRRDQHDCFVDRLLVGLRHLDHMVNDMLVFARGGQVGRETVSIRDLLEQVRKSLLPQLQERNAWWEVNASSEDLFVRGQREVLAGALSNLATNALDSCGEGAQLKWQIGSAGAEIHLALQDNGPGVPKEIREQIFEPFFTTRSNGTGLGLAVVRAVIDAHHGCIAVDAGCQQGARFVVQLPVFDVHQHLPSEMVHRKNSVERVDVRCPE
ncbi:MAG: HAMP domain-containing histidine kinase [Thiogranum sp.]|nr:HAMP domain-containing histidine kinase [Thiogranum sp.]